MKKLFLSFTILAGITAVATAQTPAAKANTARLHLVVNSTTANSKKTGSDWTAYKQQIVLDQKKKVRVDAKIANAKKTQN